MKNRKLFYYFSIFLCAAVFQNSAGAQTLTPQPKTNPENVLPKTSVSEIELVHLGDLVDVDVVGSTEYDWRGTLNAEGFLDGINFTENPIYALCQTESGIAEKIAASYAKILRDPQIVVKILDRSKRPVSILYGAVRKNLRFQIKRPVLLNELIIAAGGFNDKASGEIQILRLPHSNCVKEAAPASAAKASAAESKKAVQAAAETQYINIKISDLLAGKKESNPQILSGDIITVLEANPIYVIGGVGTPKQILLRSQLTLSRAVDSAGGLTKGADAKKITVFRRSGGETKIIEADLDKIRANQAKDVILQPFDIVEVTQTGREKRKFPPVINVNNFNEKTSANLPLQVID